MKQYLFLGLLLSLTLVTACGQEDNSKSKEQSTREMKPFYEGNVSNIMNQEPKEIHVTEEARESSNNTGNNFIFWVDEDTEIENDEGAEVDFETVSTGDAVKIWLKEEEGESEIMESNPPQAKAGKIVIVKDTSRGKTEKYAIDLQQTENDFVFRAVSKRRIYKPHEEVTIAGMLKYTGEKEEITVGHGGFQLLRYTVTEKNRDITIGWAHASIFSQTTLAKGEWHVEPFEKAGEVQETEFHKDFFNKEGLPEGSYTIKISTTIQLEDETNLTFSKELEIEVKE